MKLKIVGYQYTPQKNGKKKDGTSYEIPSRYDIYGLRKSNMPSISGYVAKTVSIMSNNPLFAVIESSLAVGKTLEIDIEVNSSGYESIVELAILDEELDIYIEKSENNSPIIKK
jgi:hypothetical protein